MSISFSVNGLMVRPFLQALSTAARVGSSLTVTAWEERLEITVVSPGAHLHLRLSIDAAGLDGYAGGREQATGAALYFCLLSRALQETVLRQAGGALQALYFQYGSRRRQRERQKQQKETAAAVENVIQTAEDNGADEDNDAGEDEVLLCECYFATGVVKTFKLKTIDGQVPCDVVGLPPSAFALELSAEPRVWGALLVALPNSSRYEWLPQPSHLELRSFSEGSGSNSSVATVSSSAQSFDLFSYFTFEEASEGDEGVAVRKSVPSVDLPGKLFDVRPLRQVAALAGALEEKLKARCGGHGVPLVFESDTTAHYTSESGAAAGHDGGSSIGSSTQPTARGSFLDLQTAGMLGEAPSAYRPITTTTTAATTTATNPGRRNISFVLHMAAQDVENPRASGGGNKTAESARPSAAATAVVPSTAPTPSSGAGLMAPPTDPALSSGSTAGGRVSVPAPAERASYTAASDSANRSADRLAVPETPSYVGATAESRVSATLGGTPTQLHSGAASHASAGNAYGSPHSPSPLVVFPSLRQSLGSGSDAAVDGGNGNGDGLLLTATATSGSQRLATLYPLDFEAFASGQQAEWGAMGGSSSDEDDEELQRFLENCTSVLVRGPTLSSDPHQRQ